GFKSRQPDKRNSCSDLRLRRRGTHPLLRLVSPCHPKNWSRATPFVPHWYHTALSPGDQRADPVDWEGWRAKAMAGGNPSPEQRWSVGPNALTKLRHSPSTA